MAKAKSIPVRNVGRCVYGCGPKHAPPLTEEHILAANLGGEFTLMDASCESCQYIINKEIEQPCQQLMFKEIRYRRGIGSRNIKKRPINLSVFKRKFIEGEALDGPFNPKEWEEELVPTREHPSLLILPVYNSPGILRNLEPKDSLKEQVGIWRHIEPWGEQKNDITVRVQMKFNDDVFCRLIAKTAHCLTVAKFGIDGFIPLLPDIILGRNKSQNRHLIGCILPTKKPTKTNHELGFAILKDDSLKSYILATVRIFADLGAPTYCAVVGKKIDNT